ncbi:MAG: HNH endonuclease [Tannerella sp.]|jgi:5-methylcytosine-specific restriction endonuclease McrA|nr:HNH endonuclease [Tannerella sp.]
MLRHTNTPKPSELTAELQEKLRQEFAATPKVVWNQKWLKQKVLDKAFGKCCYADISLNVEGNYMEIDHFLPKSKHPDKVMEWDNLLPSCKPCNLSKGDHDTKVEPIVNPFTDNPQEYLYFMGEEYYGRNEMGERTIRVLGLNKEQLQKKREEIVRVTEEDISYLFNILSRSLLPEEQDLRYLKDWLGRVNRRKSYAALISTVILGSDHFRQTEAFLKENNLWDAELTALGEELLFCSLLQ